MELGKNLRMLTGVTCNSREKNPSIFYYFIGTKNNITELQRMDTMPSKSVYFSLAFPHFVTITNMCIFGFMFKLNYNYITYFKLFVKIIFHPGLLPIS